MDEKRETMLGWMVPENMQDNNNGVGNIGAEGKRHTMLGIYNKFALRHNYS